MARTTEAERAAHRAQEGTGGSGSPAARGGWRAGLARHALLPLRVFLGVTFVYAGLDKLVHPAFLAAGGGPGSLIATLHAVRSTSAVPALVDFALKNPTAIGYTVAFGELAVGVGTLIGLLTRLAAAGGALISLSLWLTVSWSTSPYYYGNDLPYLMAWLPLVLAGAPLLSLDALIARRRRR